MKYQPYALLIILIFTSILNANAQSSNSIWASGENYTVTYLHSGSGEIDGEKTHEFTNLPVTEFTLHNFTNDGYQFIYLGYSNISYRTKIDIVGTNVPNYGEVFYPKGGFPVILPTQYRGIDNWPNQFASNISSLNTLDQNFVYGLDFFVSNVSYDENLIIFEREEMLNITNKGTYSYIDFQFFHHPEFYYSSLVNAKVITRLMYRISTGVVFEYNYTISSDQMYDSSGEFIGSTHMSEMLNFIAILPSVSGFEEFFSNPSTITLIVLIIILVIRKFLNFSSISYRR